VDATVEEPDLVTNDVLAVRLTSGPHALAVLIDVGDAPADVVLPFPAGTVAAGSASARPHADGTAVRVAPHSVTIVGRDEKSGGS
jgi:hypothetical protein